MLMAVFRRLRKDSSPKIHRACRHFSRSGKAALKPTTSIPGTRSIRQPRCHWLALWHAAIAAFQLKLLNFSSRTTCKAKSQRCAAYVLTPELTHTSFSRTALQHKLCSKSTTACHGKSPEIRALNAMDVPKWS